MHWHEQRDEDRDNRWGRQLTVFRRLDICVEMFEIQFLEPGNQNAMLYSVIVVSTVIDTRETWKRRYGYKISWMRFQKGMHSTRIKWQDARRNYTQKYWLGGDCKPQSQRGDSGSTDTFRSRDATVTRRLKDTLSSWRRNDLDWIPTDGTAGSGTAYILRPYSVIAIGWPASDSLA